ncbi:MAG: aminopeptidase, partial [Thermoplasmata archaeon]|nr:aminopeptidase [Thermoplasmata archaeon]
MRTSPSQGRSDGPARTPPPIPEFPAAKKGVGFNTSVGSNPSMSASPVPPEKMSQVARSVLTKNLQLKKGERLTVEGFSHTLDWATAFAREARHLGALPVILFEDEDAYWDALDRKEEAVLGAAAAHEWALLGKTDAYLHMWGVGDKVRLAKLPAKRRQRAFAFNDAWYAAAKKAGLRGFRLELGRPYPNLADAYGVDERTWTNQVLAGTMVDPDSLQRAAAPIARALERGRKLRIRDDAGTDLTLGLRGRKATVNAGRVPPPPRPSVFASMGGLPAGSIRVALDEAVADGTFVANRTDYFETATATGGSFEFRKGRLVDHHFASGGEAFEEGFRAGGKGRDQPGQFSIG